MKRGWIEYECIVATDEPPADPGKEDVLQRRACVQFLTFRSYRKNCVLTPVLSRAVGASKDVRPILNIGFASDTPVPSVIFPMHVFSRW